MKYVAEPLVIEAIQWDGTEEVAKKIKKEFGFDYRMDHNEKPALEIYAPHMALLLFKGGYLIKDLMGEPFACKARIFKQRFKKIKD